MNVIELLKNEIQKYPECTDDDLVCSSIVASVCGIELFPGSAFYVVEHKQEVEQILNDPKTEVFIAYFKTENESMRFIELSPGFEKYGDKENQVRMILPIECKNILKSKGIEL